MDCIIARQRAVHCINEACGFADKREICGPTVKFGNQISSLAYRHARVPEDCEAGPRRSEIQCTKHRSPGGRLK